MDICKGLLYYMKMNYHSLYYQAQQPLLSHASNSFH